MAGYYFLSSILLRIMYFWFYSNRNKWITRIEFSAQSVNGNINSFTKTVNNRIIIFAKPIPVTKETGRGCWKISCLGPLSNNQNIGITEVTKCWVRYLTTFSNDHIWKGESKRIHLLGKVKIGSEEMAVFLWS